MLTKQEQDRVYHAYQETVKLTKETKSFMHIKFKEFCEMYTFATENIKGYFSKLKLKGKKVLSVTASADHFINLALLGASEVHSFDINNNAYYMSELKIAALKTLSYEEFLLFFTDSKDREIDSTGFIAKEKKVDENDFVFDYKMYLRIREQLGEDVALYWDMLFEEYHFNGKELMASGIVHGGDRTSAIYNNLYLSNENYYNQAKVCVDQVPRKYFTMDILQLYQLTDTYDLMLFSNIYDYVTDEWIGGIKEDTFNKYVTEELSQKLNPGGKMLVAYQYHYKTKDTTYRTSLRNLFKSKYQLAKRESLEKFGFRKMLVPSVVREYREDSEKDCVYLYEEGKMK